ncbi:AAA family ATPase [Dokdonella koreensis]|uniref:Uncharacterized protein n=1 Tax=Dokdonella koreensis DS-123 TaxID=1300342 RepID=A0A160DVE7_9GAMM|nr:AAA family ATPase [Dokdonella koreensis]ANB18081.1 Hypothetical protein I596_2062 [Dokdonella koreensis DS-123]
MTVPTASPADPPADPSVPGRIVVALIGLPGAGKSTIARALEDHLRLRRICRDAIRAAMFPRCSYSFLEKRAAFRGVVQALEINCMLGISSVLDGMTFSARDDYDRIAETVAAFDFTLMPLWVDCPPERARARVQDDLDANRHLALDRTPERVDEVRRRAVPPPDGAVRIDAELPASAMCREAVRLVAARLQAGPAG